MFTALGTQHMCCHLALLWHVQSNPSWSAQASTLHSVCFIGDILYMSSQMVHWKLSLSSSAHCTDVAAYKLSVCLSICLYATTSVKCALLRTQRQLSTNRLGRPLVVFFSDDDDNTRNAVHCFHYRYGIFSVVYRLEAAWISPPFSLWLPARVPRNLIERNKHIRVLSNSWMVEYEQKGSW